MIDLVQIIDGAFVVLQTFGANEISACRIAVEVKALLHGLSLSCEVLA